MSRFPIVRCALLAGGVVLTAGLASAADTWIEVKSPNFTVVSNAGERTARNVAWQFEQIRGAIEKGWPWAQVRLSRPVTVIAVKDEPSMKAMAPAYWENTKGGQPVSVFTTAADQYYILLRADVKDDDNAGSNPYRSSYWSYSTLVLNASYGRGLPLWLTNGLAAVLSNSIVRKSEIQFGQPITEFVREAQGPRLRLEQLLAVDRTSAYYTGELTRPRFDAQSWAFMQYLLFGDTDGSRLNKAVTLMLQGTPAGAAMQQSYGRIDALEVAYSNYLKAGLFKYSRLQVASDVSAQAYPLRPLPAAESAVARAGFHVAAARPVEALNLVGEARKADPAGAKAYEIEGLLFDAENKAAEATQAFAKAADLKSDNFYVYYRLARTGYEEKTATPAALAIAEQQLNRTIQLNGEFAPAVSLLGAVMVRQNRLADALVQARRAAMLEPAEFSHREFVAWVLSRSSRPEEARQAAQQALALARTDQQRQQVQSVLDWIARPSNAPSSSAQARSDTSAPTGKSLVPAANGPTDGSASSINAPRRTKQVDPIYPEAARATQAKGTVRIEATIGPDGHVTDATVVGSAPFFDEAALAAVRQWEFEPTVVGGVAVAIKMTVAVNFGYR